jgi:hypothetical protein
LTQHAFRLLDAWHVPKDQQVGLLGLAHGLKKRQVNRYRMGTPLPSDGDCYQRIDVLFKIDGILRKLFPHSELSANLWVTTPNLRYGGYTPLDTMLKGLNGIRQVERSLNSPEDWS